VPVTGDWDGDGVVSIGIFSDGIWHLRNVNATGPADTVFHYGAPGHRPVTGPWTGARHWGVGVVVGDLWILRNHASIGEPDIVFRYGTGAPGEVAVVGDWNGDGSFTPGVVRPTSSGSLRWELRNSNTAGPPDVVFEYGRAGDVPVVGDWNLDGRWTPGVVVAQGRHWLLRQHASAGQPDLNFVVDSPPGAPLVWAARIRQ
jgi:hypothetical protein